MSVSCSSSFFVLFEAEFYVLGASCVVGSVFAEEYVNVVCHYVSVVVLHECAKNVFYRSCDKRVFMGIRYYEAPDVKQLVEAIVAELGFSHIDSAHVYCYRSKGSKSRRTVARVHSLGRLWQLAMGTRPRYLIEVIGERYDKPSQAHKERVIIHELLHIPRGFSGGFRPHKGYINKKTIDRLHETFKRRRTLLK